MILQRILAIASAAFLVAAVGVALIGPPNIPLGAALYLVDGKVLYELQANATDWLWQSIAMPMLVRPAWLLPACIGIICAGMSITLSNRQRPQRSTRRRF